MFTLKFYRSEGSNGTKSSKFQTSISCPNYSVFTRPNGSITITTYPTMKDTDGVERQIRESVTEHNTDNSFMECYVENEKGKTIELFCIKERVTLG